MRKVQQISGQLQALIQYISDSNNQIDSRGLSDQDREVLHAKVTVLVEILNFYLILINKASEKKRRLLTLCLEGKGCTIYDAKMLKYNSVDSMHNDLEKVMEHLGKTVLSTEKLNTLLNCSTVNDANEIRKWYSENVYTSKKLLSQLAD
ncbi:hypothetical protein [Cohnella yongneupensis]|uniref:Uncharacterized protein n=1 Tax=Cohnella yongneupensis TaxID=425006 RepID=A0ABW0QZM5_9BACL